MIEATYGVTLSCYRRQTNGAICLTPVILERVEADSPQEAVYLIMEQHGYLYVDRAEVVLPDGAIWEQNQALYKSAYDVALWIKGRDNELPISDEQVQAASPLLAALCLMQDGNLTYVARASVRCPDGTYWHKEHLKITKEEETTYE